MKSKNDLKHMVKSRGFRKSGVMIGWKKAFLYDNHCQVVIIKLEITKYAERLQPGLDHYISSDTYNPDKKCRASSAKVLGIWRLHKDYTSKGPYLGSPVKKAVSSYMFSFVYEVGEEVYPDAFDRDPMRVCSFGIHFFTSIRAAVDYEI